MKALAVSNINEFYSISKYMTQQKAYWYPLEDTIAYRGTLYRMFYIDPASPHISYLCIKYKIKDFTELVAENRKLGLDLIK
jgi:hypothetical protein